MNGQDKDVGTTDEEKSQEEKKSAEIVVEDVDSYESPSIFSDEMLTGYGANDDKKAYQDIKYRKIFVGGLPHDLPD